MTDYENLFRRVAERLFRIDRSRTGTHAWSKEQIEKELEAEARASRCALGEPGPLERARRLQRIQQHYQALKERKPEPEPKFVAVFDTTMPMSPKLHRIAEESGFHVEGDWTYVDPQGITPAGLGWKHPRTGPHDNCPAREIPVRIPLVEDGIEYLVAFCKTCASGWWTARKPRKPVAPGITSSGTGRASAPPPSPTPRSSPP
jgi:hypothetical protein